MIKEIGDTDRYAKPKVSTAEETYGLMTGGHRHNKGNNEENSDNNVIQSLHGEVGTTLPNTDDNATSAASTTTSSSTPINISSPSIKNASYTRPTASPLQGQKPLKSALKKVTMSDLLKRSASELQINTNLSNSISLTEANQQLGAFSPAVIASHRQPKLRFNQYVEQCVVLSSSDEDHSKKRNSRVRMAELNDVRHHHRNADQEEEDDEEEEEEEASSDNDYEPGDESDTGSVIMMRRSPKVKSSIKKIEPTLLKTNSRSDDQDSLSDSDDDDDFTRNMVAASSSGGSGSYRHHHRRSHQQHEKKSTSNNMDWDVESAESDAFVKHIINVSKGKKPAANRDPAADRIPVYQHQWDENVTDGNGEGGEGDILQAKSDYDYEFDDDDWDTHSEHAEDDVHHLSTTSDEFLPPVAPVNNQPILPPVKPTIQKSTSRTSSTDDMHYNQKHYDHQSSGDNISNSSSNASIFSSIAHWASSHLWPAEEN